MLGVVLWAWTALLLMGSTVLLWKVRDSPNRDWWLAVLSTVFELTIIIELVLELAPIK